MKHENSFPPRRGAIPSLPSSISIIARNSFSASGSSGGASFVFVFALYAALARGGGFGASSSSSSSEMTTPLLTRTAFFLLDSVRLDVDGDFPRVLAVADSSSSESESIDMDLSFDLEGLGSGFLAALDDAAGGGSSTGSVLILRVSGAGLGLGAGGIALLKSSFPEGFAGFAGLITGLMFFGSDLMTVFASSVIEGAFDRPGSLILEVEAEAEDFEDRLCWRSVRFCGIK